MTVLQTFDLLQGNGSLHTDRVTLNNALIALASGHYSDDGTEPDVTYQGMLWIDASAGYVKRRNDSDDGWLVVGTWPGSDAVPHLGVLGVYITKDTEGTTASDTIRFSLQVADARGSASAVAVTGRRRVIVAIATSTHGAPGGTQTVTVSTGVEVADIGGSADQVLVCETDANGLLEIDVAVTGAGDRFVRACVGDGALAELQGTWA